MTKTAEQEVDTLTRQLMLSRGIRSYTEALGIVMKACDPALKARWVKETRPGRGK